MRRKQLPLLSAILLISILLAACVGAAAETVTPTKAPAKATDVPAEPTEPNVATGNVGLPEVDPLSLAGDVVTAGSSTVFPLAEVMAERFQDEGFPGNVTIDSIGSGAGFERFCVAGETDISNASRSIKDSEVESYASIG